MPYSKFIDSDEAYKHKKIKIQNSSEQQTRKKKIKHHKKTVKTINPLIKIFVR